MTLGEKVVLITGASSGIGKATAFAFAAEGCRLAIGARRRERLEEMVDGLHEAGAAEVVPLTVDVRDRSQAEAAVAQCHRRLGRIDVLVNNAGLARGLRPVEEGDETEWRQMIETNVFGLLWMTRATIPIMKGQGSGHIINIGSVAGHESYPGGSVYAGSKHAERAITVALRHELLGSGIRVSTVDPGLVETEFSLVRYDGDDERASATYKGMKPLAGEDVAACIVFVAGRPQHVNIDEIIVKPLAQAGSMAVHRQD
jgi:NADP-dependent 3-hydroxy acid dehydrogenase YdfG